MPAFTATAPGKVILFGEHAVVYNHPAIAAPVEQLRARATVIAEPLRAAGQVRILAPEINLDADLQSLPAHHPLQAAIAAVLSELHIDRLPACTLRVSSTIPVAAGLGSGAAVSVAIVRALSAFLGHPLPDARVSALAFEVEKLHHGTPSGIDNTVITYARPVYYRKGEPVEVLPVPVPFTLVIADTGVASPTAVAVGDLRKAWQASPEIYEPLFDAAGEVAERARQAIVSGHPTQLGRLMDDNHLLLQRMGVSSPELDTLVATARQAGARGAKLSGGGRGGNMIALVTSEEAQQVRMALESAGATRTLVTTVGKAG